MSFRRTSGRWGLPNHLAANLRDRNLPLRDYLRQVRLRGSIKTDLIVSEVLRRFRALYPTPLRPVSS